MKNIFLYRLILGLLVPVLAIQGCKDDVNLPDQPLSDYIQVYMPQAVNGPVNKTLIVSDIPLDIIYGADYGGFGYPPEDVTVKFTVRKELVDSFNINNGTNYSLLPSDKYQLSDTVATIPKGQLATDPLKISIQTHAEEGWPTGDTYVLPVSIRESSIKINENLRTTYFVIQINQ